MKSRSTLTYRDLRLQGFTGTRYDAEMLIAQGLPHFQRDAPVIKEEVTSSLDTTPEVMPSAIASKPAKTKEAQRLSSSDADLTVTVRSLRNTPSRLRARCERGRIISDCSSSGISDDTSSSSSGSDRDSGIEMSSSNEHVAIERGVERMNFEHAVGQVAVFNGFSVSDDITNNSQSVREILSNNSESNVDPPR